MIPSVGDSAGLESPTGMRKRNCVMLTTRTPLSPRRNPLGINDAADGSSVSFLVRGLGPCTDFFAR
jgi:hypothetical protein